MKRRLNLAAALVHDPELILLDEPTVGVDPQSRNQIFDNILALKRLGRTLIYTTHYMEEAERLCDRVAIVDKGKLLALGSVAAAARRTRRQAEDGAAGRHARRRCSCISPDGACRAGRVEAGERASYTST